MKRRRWIAVGIVGIVVASATFAAIFWPRGPQPCLATIDQVQYGMTREEVIATLGGPPGDYSEGGYSPSAEAFDYVLHYERWITINGTLVVGFNEQDRARFVMVSRIAPRPPSFFVRLRFRLGL